MNLSIIDWMILAAAVIALRVISLSTRKYVKGVADFLSANRSAGRYMLTIGLQMGNLGVVSFVAFFEMYYEAGFTMQWWHSMHIIAIPVIMLTGWVYYRFRETKALTLAQFLEMRYSKKFRITAGVLAFTSGILNFGIFPAVAARFFIYFCGLPDTFHIPGEIPFISSVAIPTFPVVMGLDLILALMFVSMGGQVSVMVTECVQGIFCLFVFLVVAAAIMMQIHWDQIVMALNTAPPDASMLNPFNTSKARDFNIWFILIGLFGTFYNWMSWQGSSGYNSAARSPHEHKMGGILGTFRAGPHTLMALLLAMAAYTVLHVPEFAGKAAAINESIRHIDNPTIQGQMRVPIAAAHILPIGIKGLLATVMLFVSFTCHDTYMHSWGSIFVQDVYMPFRNLLGRTKEITAQDHIRLLRYSIFGVALFSFVFGLVYPQTQKVFMFFAITATIWLGGSGAVIIGGLYWRRGTTPAAYSALFVGATLGVTGLIAPGLYQSHFHRDFPVNGQVLWFIAMITAIVVYVTVSLLTSRNKEGFNLEKMLNRGIYADADKAKSQSTIRARWQQVVGITSEFSRGDRIVAIAAISMNLAWFGSFLVVSVLHLVFHCIPAEFWPKWWHFYILQFFVIGVPVAIWFTIGGLMDIKSLYRTLATAVRDHTDDGRVKSKTDRLQEHESGEESTKEPERESVGSPIP